MGQERPPSPFAKSDSVQSAPHPYCQPLPKPLKASPPIIPVGWATSSGFAWESPLPPFLPAALGGTR